jgi:uncharacterized membrane protein
MSRHIQEKNVMFTTWKGYFLQWLTAFCFFIIMDTLVWFPLALQRWYEPVLQKIQHRSKTTFRIGAGLVAWAIMSFAVVVLISIVRQTLSRHTSTLTLWTWMRYGAFLGFSIYGVYNFTNLAQFRDYTLFLSLVDTAWGTLVMALCTAVVAKIL